MIKSMTQSYPLSKRSIMHMFYLKKNYSVDNITQQIMQEILFIQEPNTTNNAKNPCLYPSKILNLVISCEL